MGTGSQCNIKGNEGKVEAGLQCRIRGEVAVMGAGLQNKKREMEVGVQ